MNKLRKIMYSIGLPFICIGLILIIVIMFIAMFNFGSDWSLSNVSVLVWITIASLAIGIIITLVMMPFVLKSEKKEYDNSISQDFENLDKDKLPSLFPVIGFDEAVKIQKEGLYFIKLKKLVKYSDLKISIIHKEFYGQKSNFFKIMIDQKNNKNFPKYFYIDYLKEALYQFNNYNVWVDQLENLKLTKKDLKKDTSNILKVYHYPYKTLIIKLVISLVLIITGIVIIINKPNNILAYFLMMIAIIILTNNSKTGKLYLTEQGVKLKKNFMRIEIAYDEIININITEKNMTISSFFNFIEFEPIEEIAIEIQKKVNE